MGESKRKKFWSYEFSFTEREPTVAELAGIKPLPLTRDIGAHRLGCVRCCFLSVGLIFA